MARWFTCTPVRFPGDAGFFARDSGLLSKGFQAIGIPSKAIMPGPPMDGDCTDDLIRTKYHNLEDPAWWRSLKGEGVVLYAWGAARYFPVARAIRQAGYRLVTHIDSSGTSGILGGAFAYWAALWRIQTGLGITPRSLAAFSAKFLSSFTWSLLKHDLGRSRHFHQADLIGAVSPVAAQRIRRVCQWYGGKALASRVRLLPHPVSPSMTYAGQPKAPQVVAVGRWLPEDARQKNPSLLRKVMVNLVATQPGLRCIVVGRMQDCWKEEFMQEVGRGRDRIRLLGQILNRDLPGILQSSQVFLCTSNHESFHIASAEALCCGCSVVAPDLPELPSLRWFTGENSGRLAPPHAMNLTQAVLQELDAWRVKTRNPETISELWGRRLHADRVAAQILRDVAMDSDSAQNSKSP